MSRGVRDLKRHILQEYAAVAIDFANPQFYEPWMDTDCVYLFAPKNQRPDPVYPTMPYDRVLDVLGVRTVRLLDYGYFVIALENDTHYHFLQFESAIEAWKAYNYMRVLIENVEDNRRSLCHEISVDLRVIFDDQHFNSM